MSTDTPQITKKHFADSEATKTPEAHYFEQLQLDLEWAAGAATTFAERDGADPLTALAQGFHAIAGRRWSRFKAAEEAGQQTRAAEMEAFARFWYRLSTEIEQRKPK